MPTVITLSDEDAEALSGYLHDRFDDIRHDFGDLDPVSDKEDWAILLKQAEVVDKVRVQLGDEAFFPSLQKELGG